MSYEDAKALGCLCDECPFQKDSGRAPLLPKHSPRARLALIDESPKSSEYIEKDYFAGKKANILKASFERLGYEQQEFHKTSALLCSIPRDSEGNSPSSKEISLAIECCSRLRFAEELKQFQVAMPLGNLALQSLSTNKQISNYHGAPQQSPFFENIVYVPSFHPRFILAKPYYTPVFLIHLQRAYDYSLGLIEPWAWPELVSSFHEPARLQESLGRLLSFPGPISCDVETTIKDSQGKKGTPRSVKLLNVGFASNDLMISIDTSEGLEALPPKILNTLKFLFKRKELIFQNGIFDMQVLVANGLMPISRGFNTFSHDTMIAHAICAPNLPHSLAFICGVEFAAPRWKEEFGAAKGATDDMSDKFANADPALRALYNARDNYMQFRLHQQLQERLSIQIHKGQELYARRMFLARVACEMTIRGVKVNEDARLRHLSILSEKVESARATLVDLTDNPEFNPNATRAVSKAFQALGAPILKRAAKTKEPAYTGDVLIALTSYPDQKIALLARSLLGYRKHKKLLSTYIEKLPKEKDAFGHWRVHPTWNVIGARSGRWSAKGPNLMNMPKPSKVKLGSEVIQLPGMRDILMPDEGKFLVEFDASALELRIIALLAQDSKMIEDFDKDLHTINAAMLFNKQPKLWQDIPSSADDAAHVNAWGVLTYVTDKERDFAKRFVYGSNYGGSAKTIWKSMVVDFPHLSVRDIERALKMWAQARPLVAQWKSSQILKAAEAGYAEDIFSGRRCIFYDNFEPTKALNYPIQMLAIHILDMMMLKILPKLKDYDAELLMQVHDSLVFQTSKPFEFYEFLEENLYLELSLNDTVCPFPTDGKIGLDWGNMKKLKDAKALWQKAA